MPATAERPGGSVRVTFDEREIAELTRLARRRNVPKRIHNVANQRVDRQVDEIDTDLQGITAEAAVAAYFGLEFDRSISLHGRAGAKRITHTLPSGITLQVQGTRSRDLMLRGLEYFEAAVAIVVRTVAPHFPIEVTITGGITREAFRRVAVWEARQGVDLLIAHGSALTPIVELRRRLERAGQGDDPGDDFPPAGDRGEQGKLF